LKVNLHFHTLVLNGVFTEAPEGALAFQPAPAPNDVEVAAALAATRHRVQQLLVRRGLEPGDDAAGRAVRRMSMMSRRGTSRWCGPSGITARGRRGRRYAA
jgi:hypothetical protein